MDARLNKRMQQVGRRRRAQGVFMAFRCFLMIFTNCDRSFRVVLYFKVIYLPGPVMGNFFLRSFRANRVFRNRRRKYKGHSVVRMTILFFFPLGANGRFVTGLPNCAFISKFPFDCPARVKWRRVDNQSVCGSTTMIIRIVVRGNNVEPSAFNGV